MTDSPAMRCGSRSIGIRRDSAFFHADVRTLLKPPFVCKLRRVLMTPEPECWLSNNVEVRSSDIEGEGLFARTDLNAGAILSRLGGRLVSDDALEDMMQSAGDKYVDAVSIFEDANLLLPPRTLNHCGNHGCEPNLWWVDPFLLAARTCISSGTELTIDYGTLTDNPRFHMMCECDAPSCRGVITGADWMLDGLQARYGDHWVPVLRERIRLSRS